MKYPKYLEKGMKFGRLVVVGVDIVSKALRPKAPSKWSYICKCVCGNMTSVDKYSLVTKTTQSCGCLHKDVIANIGRGNTKTNPVEIEGHIIKIYFFNCEEYTTIDVNDYPKVKDHCWFKDSNGYACASRHKVKGIIRLHRIIMSPKEYNEIDHIDHNILNNQRCNLRECSKTENSQNKWRNQENTISKTQGVHWDQRTFKWVARIGIDNKNIHLGSYTTKKKALGKRLEAENLYFGEFAPHKGKVK